MKKKRILIVDDMRTLRMALPVYLGKDEFDFDVAATGREGLEIALKNPPDLIISDVNMPDMDGLELCRALQDDAALSAVPVVLISAEWEDVEAVKRSIAAGASGLVPKPIDSAVLRAAVERALGIEKSS